MTAFRFIPITPHPLLGPYVAKIWVFESTGRLPSQERKLIVPNANLKLTLSYRNGIAARVGNKAFLQRENELTLTGLIDTPVILDPHDDTRRAPSLSSSIHWAPIDYFICRLPKLPIK